MTWLDLWQLGMEHARARTRRTTCSPTPPTSGTGRSNYVRLDPHDEPAHVLRSCGRS